MVSPRDLAISPSLGSAMPAMQRSKVDLPRPLAATSPMRSPALTERSSRENSGALSVTPRLRISIRVMVVPWSCRPTQRPGHAAINGCWCGSAASYTKAGTNGQTFDAALRRGQTRKRCWKSLWSALQTHLQGVDRAMLAIVPEKCRHRTALPVSTRYRAKNSRALKGRQAWRDFPKSRAQLARGFAVAGGVAADQRGVLPDRLRPAEEIALHRVAALVREEAELLLGLDALGNDRHFETVAEIDDGAHDRRRLRVAPEIHHKGAVDLDLVERERLQIAQ